MNPIVIKSRKTGYYALFFAFLMAAMLLLMSLSNDLFTYNSGVSVSLALPLIKALAVAGIFFYCAVLLNLACLKIELHSDRVMVKGLGKSAPLMLSQVTSVSIAKVGRITEVKFECNSRSALKLTTAAFPDSFVETVKAYAQQSEIVVKE